MKEAQKIYDLLSNKGFQVPRTGNLFFPAYIYTYAPEEEYTIRKEIDILVDKLNRPDNYLECMVINLWETVIDYLKTKEFAGKTMYSLITDKESQDSKAAFEWIRNTLRKKKKGEDFYTWLDKKIRTYFTSFGSDKRVYLIVHGVGSAFPYLRAHEFLKNTESLIKDFKILLFYPGTYENHKYRLFGILNDDNIYRANYLNQYFDS